MRIFNAILFQLRIQKKYGRDTARIRKENNKRIRKKSIKNPFSEASEKGMFFLLEIKVILCVFVAYAANYLFKSFVVLGVFALVNPFADKVAKYSSEILVAWIGNE